MVYSRSASDDMRTILSSSLVKILPSELHTILYPYLDCAFFKRSYRYAVKLSVITVFLPLSSFLLWNTSILLRILAKRTIIARDFVRRVEWVFWVQSYETVLCLPRITEHQHRYWQRWYIIRQCFHLHFPRSHERVNIAIGFFVRFYQQQGVQIKFHPSMWHCLLEGYQ